MVKPARLGSSVGMTLVHDGSELTAALDEAFRYDTLALAETYLAGARDLEVAVIGSGQRARAVRPGRDRVRPRVLRLRREVHGRAVRDLHPGRGDRRQRATMQKIARDAYRAIGGEGFARVDFLLAGDRIVLSEINTIPGFTPISLFPTMPSEAGLSFVDVCIRIVDLALERHASRAGRRLTTADLPR